MSLASELRPRLDLALEAAGAAEKIILHYYQSSALAVERKADSSPVTVADREAELKIRELIARDFPADGVLGEEYGETSGTSGFRWILDPVDGTKSFIHGVPLFGTLIGVEYIDPAGPPRPVAGVCHFPGLSETAWGAEGLGAWWRKGTAEPQRARVSTEGDIGKSLICFTTVSGFQRIGRADAFAELTRRAGLTRGWGDCYGHYLVAVGRAEAMVDPLMNPWDAAALVAIIQEAGGSFMDWQGQASIYTGNGISVNAALREEILQIATGR